MALIGLVFLTTVLQCITATDIPLPIPPPFNPRRMGFPRGPVGLIRHGPIRHLGPRLPPRLHHPMNKIWLKKFDPRVGSWIKVLKEKPNVIRPQLRRNFMRKAKINKMMRLGKFARMNIVRGGLLAGHGQRRAYQNYNRKPKRMIKILPGMRSTDFLRQGIVGRSHSPTNILSTSRRPLLQRTKMFKEKFEHDNDFIEDFKLDDHKDTMAIQNSFGSRFNAGFRTNNQPTYTDIGVAGVGAMRRQFGGTQKRIDQPSNPPMNGNVAGFQQKGYYHEKNNVPKYNMETVGLFGPQQRVLNPAHKIKSSVNTAIHESFDRKSEGPFVGMTGMGNVHFDRIQQDVNLQFPTISGTMNTGILGGQQNGFTTHSGDITGPMPQVTGSMPQGIGPMPQVQLPADRTLDPSINPNPVGDIGFPRTGIATFTVDNRVPDGLLHDHDFHDVENLDRFDDKDDHLTNELDDLNERLHHDRAFDLDDHRDFDDRLDDRFNVDDGHHNSFPQIPQVQNGRHDFLNMPHIAQANDRFDEQDKGFEFDSGHHGHDDSHRHGHDDSPIDGLELLGSSRWSDIISELTNAASHNQIFDQVPRESIPVFPVNPHSSAGPSVSGEHDMFGDGKDDMGPGTLALLGIDPRNVATDDMHPPPFTIPQTFETVHKQNSINSITTAETVVVTKNDDSVTTVVTKQPVEINKGTESKPTTTGLHGPSPTLDISNAAKQLAMFGALDNLEFGNDSFDEDLKL